MRILMLSSTFPYPPSRGGTEIRTFNLLKYLASNHDVILVTQYNMGVSEVEIAELQKLVGELILFPLAPEPSGNNVFDKFGRLADSLVSATPPNVLYRYSPKIQKIVDDYVGDGKCDVITCEHSVNEIYIRPEFRHSVNTVVNVHSSVYGWTRNHLQMGASPNQWRDRLYLSLVLQRYERRYAQKFSRIVVTTEDDRQEFLQLRPGLDIKVIPNGVDLDLFPLRTTDPGGHKLIYVGAMDASHNIDAVVFFTREVLPQIQDKYPDTTFAIVGAKPTNEVRRLEEQKGVVVTGKVNYITEYLHKSTIFVVPLRSGFGIKNKTLEAMAAGVPVVGSDRGLEGLSVDGAGIPPRALRANNPTEYVQAIAQLFNNPQLRHDLSANARRMIETEFTWEKAGKLYEEVCLTPNKKDF